MATGIENAVHHGHCSMAVALEVTVVTMTNQRTENWSCIPHLTQTHLTQARIVKQREKRKNTVLADVSGQKC